MTTPNTNTEVEPCNTMGSTRNWAFTWMCHNDPEGCGMIWDPNTMKYLIQGHEKCPSTNTYHWQGFIIFKNARKLSGLKKIYNDTIHWEPCRKSAEANITYCKKEGSWTERGDPPKGRGFRSDIIQITDRIREGLDDRALLEEFGDKWIRNYRGIREARAVLNGTIRDWAMDVRIYHGPPGTGKTKAVWDEFGLSEVYPKMVGKWWDGYSGQTCVLIDDFDPANCFDVQFDFYLKLLDRYPLNIEWKGGSGPFRSKVIIFTSNFHPDDWFINKENRSAFFRRIGRIQFFH